MIHIKKSRQGSFRRAARRRGLSVGEFARRVLRNRSRYSPAMVKKANFARNARKWRR